MEKDTTFIDRVVEAFLECEEEPYKVLYTYGSPEQTGKLAEKVCREYRARHPEAVIFREDGTYFNMRLIQGIKCGHNPARMAFADYDLLVFENIEGISGRQTSEEIVYLMLDRTILRGKKVLVTGNVPAIQQVSLAPRICAHLSGGIHLAV